MTDLSKLKVAIVTSYSFPSAKATANRIDFFVRTVLKAKTAEVFILSAGEDDTLASKIDYKLNDGVTINHIIHQRHVSTKLLVRSIFEIHQFVMIFITLLRIKPDFTIFSIPSAPLLALGILLRKKHFSIDVRDAVWDYLAQGGIFQRVAAWGTRLLLKCGAPRALFVSVTNDAEKAAVMKLTSVPPLLLRNGISENKFNQLAALEFPIKNNEKPVVTYTGNVGKAQHLDTLVEAIATDREFNASIAGDGTALDKIREEVIALSADNITLKGRISWDQVIEEYRSSDILYAQIGHRYSSAVPTKIFEYLAIGKPVVLGLPPGPAKEIFSQFSGVYFHEPENAESLRQVLDNLDLDSKIERTRNINIIRATHLRELQQEKLLTALDGIAEQIKSGS